MKDLRRTLALLCALVASAGLWVAKAHAAATVVGETLVSSVRTGRTTFDYTYTLTLSNAQPALNSATVTVASTVPSTVVLKSSVSVPALPAGTTTTTTDTFVIQQDRTVPFSWSNLTFTVIPGPGPVAQGTINAAAGGTISVTDPGDPLFGTQIVIPPGALGDPTDTITIAYSNALPGPLNANATQAGMVPVGPPGVLALTLSKQGPSPFRLPVIVTMPYSTAALGANDDPTVVYWEPSSAQYAAIQVLGVDHIQNQVTFATKHFSSFAQVGLPGLQAMLLGQIPFIPQLQSINTGFDPTLDGFEAQNYGSGLTDGTSGGVCYGVTSYAVWYYREKPSPTRLFAKYQTASDPGVSHVPQEDALAREIMAKSWSDVNGDLADLGNFNPEGRPVPVMQQMLLELLATQSPQLLSVAQTNNFQDVVNNVDAGHSVVVYAWNASTLTFSIYDPNVVPPFPQPPVLQWSTQISDFVLPWNSGGQSYVQIFNDASDTHYDIDTITDIYQSIESGGPIADAYGSGWSYNTLSINSPLGTSATTPYPGGTSAPIVYVDPVNPTNLTVTWNCGNCDPTKTYYVHVYQNNVEQPFPQSIANNGTAQVQIPPLTEDSNELFAFVSTVSSRSFGPLDQSNIGGYAGFQRVELMPKALSFTVFVPTILAGWFNLPGTITVSGLTRAVISKFQQTGDPSSTCGGERGTPLFSSSVDASALFFSATSVTGMPYEITGPAINDNPCSSFAAYDLPDAQGNGRVWINATGRGQRFGSFTEDWEYQLRYYSGNPANNYTDASCTLNTVTNDGTTIATPVQCTLQCTAVAGKIPNCASQ